MYMKFTGTLVLNWLFWTWAIKASPTRSDLPGWRGSGRGWTPWNQNRWRTQCVHTLFDDKRAWTELMLPGCHMSQNPWDSTTNTMISTGIPCPQRKKSSSFQSPTDYSKNSFDNNMMEGRQNCFYRAAFKHCLGSCPRCLSYTDLCSRTRDLLYCNQQSLETLNPLQLLRTSGQAGRENYDVKKQIEPRGDSTSLSIELSLPGPDSGGRSTSSLTATHSVHAPADVRVRGTEGQQPLEAFRPQKSEKKANLFDHVFKDGDPKGIFMQEPAPPQDRSCRSCQNSFTRLPNKGRQGRLLPPMVLAGTAIIMIVFLVLPQGEHVSTRQWQVVRLFRGIYARRLRPRSPKLRTAPYCKARRSLNGKSPRLGWRLGSACC